MSLSNNNPFNIRTTKINWKGEGPKDEAFEDFTNLQDGIRAGFKNIIVKYKRDGVSTVAKMLAVLSPKEENPLPAYISYVTKQMGVEPDEPLDFTNHHTLFDFGKAVTYFETGVHIPDLVLIAGMEDALCSR